MFRKVAFHYCVFVALLLVGFPACTEPYQFDNEEFDAILIVDGAITNLKKKHRVYLSRAYAFDGRPEMETGAVVEVQSSAGVSHFFFEKEEGSYESEYAFAAQPNTDYSVHITTKDGKRYASIPMQLPEQSNLLSMTAEAVKNDIDQEGIGIYIDAESPSNNSRLYRFEYEETYKVVAPYWTPYDAVVVFEGTSTFATDVILRETEERVCYGTDYSDRILLRSTTNQTQDKIQQEQIHFIPITDAKLMYRYSVLIRLLVETQQTYSYFETLKDLSVTSSSFFTEKQPGYIAGNIINSDQPNEKVGGFFRVSAAAEQRIFLTLTDYYPDAAQPEYFTSCIKIAPIAEGSRGNRNLLNIIYSGYGRFYQYNRGIMPGGPYIMVNAPCGDCTVYGSNKIPDFWIP